MPLLEREPHIQIQDGSGGRVSISVRHYGRVPDLTAEFSPEVLSQAVNKWRRTSREHRILKAAMKLSWTAYRVVEAHLIRERALKVELKLEAKARRASWTRSRAKEPQPDSRRKSIQERADYDRHQERPARELSSERSRHLNLSLRSNSTRDDRWFDEVVQPQPSHPARAETLTQKAQRELEADKARAPKATRSERKALQRALTEREESLRDLVEFKPEAKPRETLTQKAQRLSKAERAVPRTSSDRDRSR